MSNTATGVRVAGGWLAAASLLLAVVLALHGPLASTLEEQMRIIAASATRWGVVHWIAAVALSSFTVAGLIMLAAGSRHTGDWWTMSAWAVLPVGALWTATTAVVEVTVITEAAVAGNLDTFMTWWAFAEGKGAGVTALALAVAVIAGNEAGTRRGTTPAWAAWIAMAAGIGSFAGWALGIWIGVPGGNLLWVVSSLLMTLWTFWFGVALARSTDTSAPRLETRPLAEVSD